MTVIVSVQVDRWCDLGYLALKSPTLLSERNVTEKGAVGRAFAARRQIADGSGQSSAVQKLHMGVKNKLTVKDAMT